MTVDVDLRYVSDLESRIATHSRYRSMNMDIIRNEREPIHLLTSASAESSEALLAVRYRRAQIESPVFFTVYNGINQNVDIKIAAVVMNAAPEPLIGLYDFIMTTFVPQGDQTPPTTPPTPEDIPAGDTAAEPTDESKINVVLQFAGVRGNDNTLSIHFDP